MSNKNNQGNGSRDNGHSKVHIKESIDPSEFITPTSAPQQPQPQPSQKPTESEHNETDE